ncbi:hypothetical protein Pint_18506 [Pistacia integerrima]|uniref:Uncharacterized protein n=1 Tax=Pistacia integerrima TaxID=434235 RepID=A0ACC0YYM2_9ROSI|nr:hypothetical protein Pint_18506 [Pistacia integerrima]
MLLLQLETPCYAEGFAKFSRFKAGPGNSHSQHTSVRGFKAHPVKKGDEVFGAEKRKVYTGPNPLHNR